MEPVEIWHNPSCSKSRTARTALDEAGVAFRVRRYLDDAPTEAELREVLARLGAQPWEICRTGEADAAALGMADWPRDEANADRWVAAMAAHPRLIQRPILLFGDGSATVARSPESLSEALRREAGPQG